MKYLVLASALVLAGCVSAQTSMLDERTMAISAHGSAFNNMSSVVQKTLLKAAEATKERGFSHFAILSSQDASTTGVYRAPTTTESTAFGSATCTGYSCYGSASGTSTTYGGNATTFIKPGADVTIRFLYANEVQEGQQGVWSAESIIAAQGAEK